MTIDQPGIQTYIKLESILLKPVTAVVDVEAVVQQYPEIDGNCTAHPASHAQADDWDHGVSIGTTEVTLQVIVVSKLVGLDPVVRGLFPQVEQLVRLLLTIPCSSAEAERSFLWSPTVEDLTAKLDGSCSTQPSCYTACASGNDGWH